MVCCVHVLLTLLSPPPIALLQAQQAALSTRARAAGAFFGAAAASGGSASGGAGVGEDAEPAVATSHHGLALTARAGAEARAALQPIADEADESTPIVSAIASPKAGVAGGERRAGGARQRRHA